MSELGSIARVSGSIAEPADFEEPGDGATAGGIPSPELPLSEPLPGGEVVEVVALFHDTIVETRHFAPPQRRDLRRRALVLLSVAAVAAGAALVLLVLAFARVRMLSLAVDITFFALFVAGFAIFTWGMVRRFEARAPRDFTIGTAPDAQLPVPEGTLALPRFPLLAADGEGHLLQLTDGMEGELTLSGCTIALADVDGATASKSLPGVRAIPFVDGMEAKIVLGDLTIILRHTDGARRESTTTPPDPSLLMSQAGAFALFMIAMTIVQAMPRQFHGMGDSPAAVRVRLDRWSDGRCVGPICGRGTANDVPNAPKQPQGRTGDRRAGSAVPPAALPVGERTTSADPGQARALAEERARHAGLNGLLDGRRGVATSILGSGGAFGSEVDNVFTQLNGLSGTASAGGWGAGGLGLVGTGHGGGGEGEGTISLGSLGTVGRGGGVGSGYSYSHGHGGLTGRRAVDPSVVIIAPQVRGGLDKEIIRRVIRRHYNEIRYCYEKELLQQPHLEGRIDTQFTIQGGGMVVAVANVGGPAPGESDLVEMAGVEVSINRLESCVLNAVRRWEFPAAADGGITVVNYPFSFHVAGE